MIKKSTEAVLALSDIAKSTWSMQHRYARQLFKAVIASCTDYGCTDLKKSKHCVNGAIQTYHNNTKNSNESNHLLLQNHSYSCNGD